MKTIIIENDVFSEDEQNPKNSAQIASNYFNVVQINDLLDLINDDPALFEEIRRASFYRGSFASGAIIRRENSAIRYSEKSSFFNCSQWVPPLKDYYINRNYNFVDMERCRDLDFPLFIRPCSGNKSFSGQLFTSKENFETEYKFTTVNRNISKYELCLYAKPKSISEEYRCVFIDHNLVSACGYLKNGGRSDFACPKDVICEAIRISTDPYFDIPNFVIDVCRNDKDDSLRLLEINSVYNASFYSCDLHAIYESLASYLSSDK